MQTQKLYAVNYKDSLKSQNSLDFGINYFDVVSVI